MRLSPKYTTDDWAAAFAGAIPNWDDAIDIVEDRIKGRFFQWIDPIVQKRFAGFVIIAMDCLLLETLHGFLTGASTRDTRNVYMTMLMAAPFGFDKALAIAFYENVRCGVLHDTETRKGWLIRMMKTQHIVEQDSSGAWIVNRTMFHHAVVRAFAAWIVRMRTGDLVARNNMRHRMDEIIASSV